MAYKIQYDASNSGQIRRKTIRKISGKNIILILLLLIVMFTVLFTDAHKVLIDFLIPGDDAVTIRAVNVFNEEVKAGQSFYDALTAFCREILFSAKS